MCTTGRLPLAADAVLITVWIAAAVAPTGTSQTGRCKFGNGGGMSGMAGFRLARDTVTSSTVSSRPLLESGLPTVNVLPMDCRSESMKLLHHATGPTAPTLLR